MNKVTHPSSFTVLAAGIRRKPPSRYGVAPRVALPECFSSSMTIYVVRKFVGDIDPSRMHLIDPSCRGEAHNETHYVIGTGYGMCGTTFQVIFGTQHSLSQSRTTETEVVQLKGPATSQIWPIFNKCFVP